MSQPPLLRPSPLERECEEREQARQRSEHARNAALHRWNDRSPKPGTVSLPYSGRLRSNDPYCYCALILHAPRFARDPFELQQVVLRPGSTIPLDALWPTPTAPRIPVLIECTRSPRARQGVCPYQREAMYVLWRFNPSQATPESESVPRTDLNDAITAAGFTARSEGTWIEVTRCYSMHGEWFLHMHPAIVRELARSGAQPVEPDLAALSQKAAEFLDALLRDLREDERAGLLACIHDLLAARIAATGHSVTFHATVETVPRFPPGIETEAFPLPVAEPPGRAGPGSGALSPVRRASLRLPRTSG
jgi:hypothetical protein